MHKKIWVDFWVFIFMQEGNPPAQTLRNHKDLEEEQVTKLKCCHWAMATFDGGCCQCQRYWGTQIQSSFQPDLVSLGVLHHASSLGGKGERLRELVLLWNKEALGWPNCGLLVPEGSHEERWREKIYRGLEWQDKAEWLQTEREQGWGRY